MKYKFEDFNTYNEKSIIVDGEFGYRLEVSILNPYVPSHYKKQVLKMLDDFIESNSIFVSGESIDSIAGQMIAYIDDDVDINSKYALELFVWNNEKNGIKDYIISESILPTDEHFSEFKECIITELINIIFGSEGGIGR